MGEPAKLTDAERENVLAYARKLVEAVTDDEEEPIPIFLDGRRMPDDVMLFQLSLVITELRGLTDACGVPDGPAMLTRCGRRDCPKCHPR